MADIQNYIDSEKNALTSSSEYFTNVQAKISSNREALKSLDLQYQFAKIETEKLQKTLNDYNGALGRLMKENPWIPEQEE